MTPKQNDIKSDTAHLVRLVASLLASGHYTTVDVDDGPPEVKTWDAGKDYKECDLRHRLNPYVVDHAEDLLRAIKERAEDLHRDTI